MAIKARKTLGGILLVEVDANPIVAGADAPVGSLAMLVDSLNSRQFTKVGPLDTDWIQASVSGEQVENSISTNDDTPSDLLVIPVPVNTLSRYTVDVNGVTEEGDVGASYVIDVTAKNTEGVVEIIDQQNRFTSSQDENLDINVIADGANLKTQVTGLSGVTLNWGGIAQENKSSSFTPTVVGNEVLYSLTGGNPYQGDNQWSNTNNFMPFDFDTINSDFVIAQGQNYLDLQNGTYRITGEMGFARGGSNTRNFNFVANKQSNTFSDILNVGSSNQVSVTGNDLNDYNDENNYVFAEIDATFVINDYRNRLVVNPRSNSAGGNVNIGTIYYWLKPNFKLEKIS